MANLTTEQRILKNWLEKNFISGYYFSIEEIVENVRYADGTPIFKLNTDSTKHDKCIKLSKMIKDINWNNDDGYRIIIKDSKGGCKLAENEEELNSWRNAELKKVEKKYQYLNNLKWKAKRDGTVPILDQENKPVEKPKIVEVYKQVEEDEKYEQLNFFGISMID